MFYSDSLRLLALLVVSYSIQAAPHKGHLVQFYRISQEQYDSILGLTSGKPVITEGRLISSGFRTLNDWRTSLTSDFRTGLRDILNVTGILPTDTKTNKERGNGYPLCVIKTNDMEYKGDDDDEENDDMDTTHIQGRADNDEDDADNDNRRPVVSCVVVVKDKNEEKEEGHVQHQPQSPQRTEPTQYLRSRLVPYYYQPYSAPYYNYPSYPYYNYPYYPQTRQNIAPRTFNRPDRTYARNTAAMQRSNDNGKHIYAENSEGEASSTARSSYPSYPYYLGSYGNIQQGNPYGSLYGGCQVGNPYNYIAANNDDDSSSEEDVIGEIGGEVSGEDFD